jgi:hypothetical protein
MATMTGGNHRPPFVDEHVVTVEADIAQGWAAVEDYATRLTRTPHRLLSRVLGTDPASGFRIAESEPPRRVTLTGRHRFSTYQLVFEVVPATEGTQIRALTFAEFPGLRGLAYRTFLTVSRAHPIATRRMLRAIARGVHRVSAGGI